MPREDLKNYLQGSEGIYQFVTNTVINVVLTCIFCEKLLSESQKVIIPEDESYWVVVRLREEQTALHSAQ